MTSIIPAHAAWEAIAPLPQPAAGFVAAELDGKLIVAGGTNWPDGTKHWLDTIWVFDPAKKEWTTGPSLPHPVAYAGFASDGARLYFAGGADGKEGRKGIYALDASLKLTHLGDVPQPVVFPGAAIHGGALYILGGTPDPDDWGKATTRLDAINITDGTTFTLPSIQGLPHGIGLPAVVVAGGDLYTFTGACLDEKREVTNLASASAYAISAKQWRTLAPYPEPTRGVCAVPLDDEYIYLAGGYGDDFLTTAFVYHRSTDRYSPSAPLPIAATSCLIKGREYVYLLGGEDQKKHRIAACWRIPIAELLPSKTATTKP